MIIHGSTTITSILTGVLTASTSGSAVDTNAAAGSSMDITASASFTLNNPTNSANGQRFIWRVYNSSGGAITITPDGNFRFGSDVTAFTTVAAGKVDVIGAMYNTINGVTKWDVTSYTKGF